MTKKQPKDYWRTKILNIFDNMPESDGFDAATADKQIEGLLEAVMVIGEQTARNEDELTRLYNRTLKNLKVLKKRMEEDVEDYDPSTLPPPEETIYM